MGGYFALLQTDLYWENDPKTIWGYLPVATDKTSS
jgi:hypothetical protein